MDGIAHLLREAHIDVPCPYCERNVFVDVLHLRRNFGFCAACHKGFELDPKALLESLKLELSAH